MRGKTLLELSGKSRWSHGPAFLQQSPECWPKQPATGETEDSAELRKPTVCCLTMTVQTSLLPDIDQFSFFRALTEAVAQSHHGVAAGQASLTAEDYQEAEREVLRQAQQDSFTEEFNL